MQDTLSLQNVIEQVSKERGIDPKILVEATEQAILTAAKRTFGPNRELEARFNAESGAVDLFQYMTVVEKVENPEREISFADAKRHGLEAQTGEELGFQVFYMKEDSDRARQQDKDFGAVLHLQQQRLGFGRIAAQTAKQVIMQRVRDAERDRVYLEYKDRQGELITGVVRRFEKGSNIIVDLDQGRTEAVLPAKEQTPRETYRPGDRIVAFIKDIDREARGPQIILSRADTGLMVKLFEMEVPEIYEGIVRIVSASREPGSRSKIAVTSRDSDVDPVGACVGMKGSRVQAVVQELRGEKIDIVPWDRDPARFVCNAIAPAEVVRVIIDENGHAMELVVPDVKLSLAIGRRGQNVRLASQLTGWKLDIISEARFRQIEEEALGALMRVEGVDETLAKNMYKSGFRSLDEVVEASEQELAASAGCSVEKAVVLRENAAVAMEILRSERIEQIAESAEPLSELEKFRLIRGVTTRLAEVLQRTGYRTIQDLARETDGDRLRLKSGLSAEQAQTLLASAQEFVQNAWPGIDQRRKQAKVTYDAQVAEEAARAAESLNQANEHKAAQESVEQGPAA